MLVETLLQRLREFFVDVTEANVAFHLGDLFDPSQFRLRDVFLKTEVMNALHLPVELKAGYLGDVRIEGFVGFVTGEPLTIGVDNVCLVLGHKPIDWNHELALRYAKELLLTILQSIVGAPSKSKHHETTSTDGSSPLKWILGKIQSTIAQTTVKLDRLHVRFESEHEGQQIAYGVYIPTVQLSTRDLNDQILTRRQQPGVTYPIAPSDNTASKRFYLANISIYCDLHATSFLGPSPPKQPPTTPRSTAFAAAHPTPMLTLHERLAFMREQCLAPFTPNPDRDLVLISALWVKLDFVRADLSKSSLSSWGFGAVDVVTEEIKVNVDFTQLEALNDELAKVTDFFQREQRRAWRPSHIDREHIAPINVTVSSTALLPVVTDDLPQLVTTTQSPRCFNRAWLRGMWRYAAHCVLVEAHTGDQKRVRLGKWSTSTDKQTKETEADHQRYMELYTRSLSEENLRIILFGRSLLPSSPRATEAKRKQQAGVPLAIYDPLTLAEQWNLSDLVTKLTILEQRRLRHAVAQRVKADFTASQSGTPTSTPVASRGFPTRSLSIEIPDDEASEPTRRPSGASISPGHSPRHSTPLSSLATVPLPPDFMANHHHHYTRSRAESSPTRSPTKFEDLLLPSPTATSSHPHLSHSASAPVDRHKPGIGKDRHYSLRAPPSPTHFSRQQWFIESLVPSWLLHPSRVIPLINWHIGPLSLRLYHRAETTETTSLFSPPTPTTTSTIPLRSVDTFMEFYLDGCTGCMLLSKIPSVSFLVEFRLGLLKVAFVNLASSNAVRNGTTGNSIMTDYIREPSDGFFYVGLKYNFKHATHSATEDDDVWDLKAKLCVGTIHIEYDDMALKTAMRANLPRRSSFSSYNAAFLSEETQDSTPSIRLESASYMTIIHDVLGNWKTFLQRVQPPKTHLSPPADLSSPVKDTLDADRKQRQRAATKARVTKLLNALMLQSSCIDVDTSGMEVQLSVLTSNLVERAKLKTPTSKSLPLFDSEQVHVTLPTTSAGLQNRPLLNECQVHAGGARLKFRTTKHGRAAAIDHMLHCMFPPRKNEPDSVPRSLQSST